MAFRLWITGEGLVSERARSATRRVLQFMEQPLSELVVVDTAAAPERAQAEGVLVTPTLERVDDSGGMRVCIDLDDVERVVESMAVDRRALRARRGPEVPEEALVQGAHGMHARLWIDGDGCVVSANATAERLFGATKGHGLSGRHLGLPLVTRDQADANLASGEEIVVRTWSDGQSDGALHLIEITTRHDELRVARELEALRGRIALLEAQVDQAKSRGQELSPSVEDFEPTLSIAQARARRVGKPTVGIMFEFSGLTGSSPAVGEGPTIEEIMTLAWMRLRNALRPGDRMARADAARILVLPEDCRPGEAREIGERLMRVLQDAEAELPAPAPALGTVSAISRLGSWVQRRKDANQLFDQALDRARQGEGPRLVGARGGGPLDDFQSHLASILAGEAPITIEARPFRRLADRKLIGHGLSIRGPEGPLSDPKVLFGLALDMGRTIELDLLALWDSARIAARLPGRSALVLRLSPITMQAAPASEILSRLEVAEHRERILLAVSDHQLAGCSVALTEAAKCLTTQGVDLVIDDVTPGPGALEAMLLLRPKYLRLDQAAVHKIALDQGARRRLARFSKAAASFGVRLIAEGVANRDDILTLGELGVYAVQEAGNHGQAWSMRSHDLPTEIHIHHVREGEAGA